MGEAQNGRDLLELADKQAADVFIVDISMPLLNGIEATYRLLKRVTKAKVIILSMHNDHSFVEKALRCGAYGYLLKDDATTSVVTAIREVMHGRYFLSPNISGFVVKGFLDGGSGAVPRTKGELLSSREKEILQLLAEGHSVKEIAGNLNISVHTVNTHKKSIMGKLGVHRQGDLIRYALKEMAISV